MINFTDREKEIMNSDSCNVNVTLEFPEISLTIGNDKIYSESLSLEESLLDGDNVQFGKCNAACFKIKVADFNQNVVGKQMNVTLRFSLDGTDANTVQFRLGTYTVLSAERTADRMWKNIVAYDNMIKFDVDISNWYNNTIYSDPNTKHTVKNLINDLASFCGVEMLVEKDFANGNLLVGKTIEPNALSGRSFLQSLCEINGVFGHINNEGKLEFIRFDRHGLLYPSDTLYPSDNLFPTSGFFDAPDDVTLYKSCDFKDYETSPINKINIRMENDDIGISYTEASDNFNTYTILGNPIVFGLSQDELITVAKNLYDVYGNFYYTPCKTVLSKSLNLQIGMPYDLIAKIPKETDVEEVKFTSYILARSLNGIQAISSSLIAEGTESQQEYVSPLNSAYNVLQGKYHDLVVDLDTFKSEIGTIEGDSTLVSRIQQNYDSITSEVKRATGKENELSSTIEQTEKRITQSITELQNQVNGQVTKYSGSGVPTLSNYPANTWDDAKKLANIGATYIDTSTANSYRFMHDDNNGYFWQIMSDSDINELKAQVRTLGSEIEQTSESISQTVSKTLKLFDEKDANKNPITINYYNMGLPDANKSQWEDTKKTNDRYLDITEGKVYKYNGSAWVYEMTLNTFEQETSASFKETNDAITAEVRRAGIAEESLSSRIKQTAKSIDLSVNNGRTSSGITIKLTDEEGNTTEETENITFTGLVAFEDLEGTGKRTKINGDIITTGTINGNLVNVTNINANNVVAGVLQSSNYQEGRSGTSLSLNDGKLNVYGNSAFNWSMNLNDASNTKIGVSMNQNGMEVYRLSEATSYNTIYNANGIWSGSKQILEVTGQTKPTIQNLGSVSADYVSSTSGIGTSGSLGVDKNAEIGGNLSVSGNIIGGGYGTIGHGYGNGGYVSTNYNQEKWLNAFTSLAEQNTNYYSKTSNTSIKFKRDCLCNVSIRLGYYSSVANIRGEFAPYLNFARMAQYATQYCTSKAGSTGTCVTLISFMHTFKANDVLEFVGKTVDSGGNVYFSVADVTITKILG